jgi:hypothetical protein
MVNHPNRKVSYPSHVLVDALRAASFNPRLLWEERGPKDTAIAWLSCYSAGRTVFIVETYKDENGWEVFTSSGQVTVDATIAEVIERCKQD